MCGLCDADTAEPGAGHETVCDRSSLGGCYVCDSVYHRPGMAACGDPVDIRQSGSFAASHRLCRGVAALGAIMLFSRTQFGANLSFNIGGFFSLQPSEFVKISFVFFVSAMFYRSTEFKTVAVTTAAAAAHVLILVLSKDLGGALIFFVSYLTMLFIATSNWLYLGSGVMGGAAASVAAYHLFSHVQRRVKAWRDPWADVDNTGYQIAQALFAVGTGGFFGMGLY